MKPYTLWRLYTEARENLPSIVRGYFDGAAIIATTGIWRGAQELGAIIEVLVITGHPRDAPKDLDGAERILALAADIRRTNEQTSVLITRSDVDAFESTTEPTL